MTEGGCGTGPREALPKFQGAQREPDKHTQRKHRVWFPSRQLGKNYRRYWGTSTRPAQHRLPDKITPTHTEKGELPHQPALPHTNSRSCSSPAAKRSTADSQVSDTHSQPGFSALPSSFLLQTVWGFLGGTPLFLTRTHSRPGALPAHKELQHCWLRQAYGAAPRLEYAKR